MVSRLTSRFNSSCPRFSGLVLFFFLLGLVACSEQNSSDNEQAPESSNQVSQDYHASTDKPQTLANPASVYCHEVGGESLLAERANLGTYGICQFKPGFACEEWALYRGECPVGGFELQDGDDASKYCQLTGGRVMETLAYPPSRYCQLPSGHSCDLVEYYNGDCPQDN